MDHHVSGLVLAIVVRILAHQTLARAFFRVAACLEPFISIDSAAKHTKEVSRVTVAKTRGQTLRGWDDLVSSEEMHFCFGPDGDTGKRLHLKDAKSAKGWFFAILASWRWCREKLIQNSGTDPRAVCKNTGTDPARLAGGMLALFASTTVDSIAKSNDLRGSAPS